MTERLSLVAPDLAESLIALERSRARAVAVACANWAAGVTGLRETLVVEVLRELQSDRLPSQGEIQELEDLTDQLDEMAWDIQEKDEQHGGLGDSTQYLQAFRRARACAAVLAATSSDPDAAALDAAYEAWAATQMPSELRQIISDASGRGR